MLLWVIFALMTAAVLAAVLAPLARPVPAAESDDAGAIEVYRHQLDEIESEQARGLVDAGEAQAARTEISRRLLASAAGRDGRSLPAASAGLPPHRMALAVVAAVLVTLSSLALYLAFGEPDMPAFPVAERKTAPLVNAPLAELIAKVETRLREKPDDGDGWDVIAPVYFKLDRFHDAANAYARAAELKGETVKRLAGRAEASIYAADGIITDDARRASERLLKLEPGHPQAQF